MRPQFVEGSWVFYNNPGHQFHMSFFQISKIVPMTMSSPGGYELVYGARWIFAKVDQILHRQDPQVQYNIMNPTVHKRVTNRPLLMQDGHELDHTAKMLGTTRNVGEDDVDLRVRLHGLMRNMTVQGSIGIPEDQMFMVRDGQVVGKIENIGTRDSHEGHEVIENYAGGKAFKYCRKCKVEVS